MKSTACLIIALTCLSSIVAQAAGEAPAPLPPAQSEAEQTPSVTSQGDVQPPVEDKKAPDPAPTPEGAPQPDPKEEEVVCKRVESASGSRIGTKQLCLTVREWRDYKEPE